MVVLQDHLCMQIILLCVLYSLSHKTSFMFIRFHGTETNLAIVLSCKAKCNQPWSVEVYISTSSYDPSHHCVSCLGSKKKVKRWVDGSWIWGSVYYPLNNACQTSYHTQCHGLILSECNLTNSTQLHISPCSCVYYKSQKQLWHLYSDCNYGVIPALGK